MNIYLRSHCVPHCDCVLHCVPNCVLNCDCDCDCVPLRFCVFFIYRSC